MHGQSKDALAKTKAGAWEYDVVAPLYKCNMTDLQAAIGLAQMKRYDGILARRRELIGRYDAALKPEARVEVLEHFTEKDCSSGHLYLTRLPGRSRETCNEIITRMAEQECGNQCALQTTSASDRLTANLGFQIRRLSECLCTVCLRDYACRCIPA